MRYQMRLSPVMLLFLAIFLALPAVLGFWFLSVVIALLLLCLTLPETYQTTPDGLLVRSGLFRKRFFPYREITRVWLHSGTREDQTPPLRDVLVVGRTPAEHVTAGPVEPEKFFEDLALRVPHLQRRGRELARPQP
jgi:uncharacterized protein (DUF58 family)